MRTLFNILAITYFFSGISRAQGYPTADTMIVYDLISHTIDTILPVSVDPSITFDHTSSSVGSMVNQVPLSLTPPTVNLFTNSSFSKVARAELFFNVADYPIRTAAALRRITDGDTTWGCSGMMVAPDYYLTAGHCVGNYFSGPGVFDQDSFLVAPGYDNGTYHTSLPTSMADKIYVFKKFYDRYSFIDIALIHLQQPIGLQIGWTGIAFSSDTSYFTGKVFHKFSYPGQAVYPDTTHYNGDTLFYQYGNITQLSNSTDLGVPSPYAQGIIGQSGSTFMYTDNIDYYSFGVANFSLYCRHFQIDNDIFYQFKQILDGSATGSKEIARHDEVKVYPNPCVTSAIIKLDKAINNGTLSITNLYGQEVKHIMNISGQTISFARENLANGIYILQLTENKKILTSGKLVIAE